MTTLTHTLTAHLRGFNIPRGTVHRIVEAVKLFEGVPVGDAANAVNVLRDVLDWIAENSTADLSIKQKLAIRKSYLVLKYPDSHVTSDMLGKDQAAISSCEPCTVEHSISFIKKGITTISGWDTPIGDPVDLATLTYQVATRHSKPTDDFHRNWAHRYINSVDQFNQLPQPLKVFKRWSHVFSGMDVIQTSPASTDVVGTVGVTFEQGMKIRLFASPYLHFQAFLEPVKRYLQKICNQIPEDYHGDQTAGRLAVQQALRDGKMVHCYDLSSATHLFPWSIQLRMLKMVNTIPSDYLRVLDYSVKGVYTSKYGDFKWNSGQPLGLGPSFFTFSLCHHALIRGIFARLGKDPSGGYALLGDDVAIFDKAVAKGYVKMMKYIGCVINISKSIISSTQAEFAGAYIDQHEITNIGKFRKIDHNNIMDYSTKVWDVPAKGYESVRSFVNRTEEDLSSLFISQYLLSKSNLVFRTDGIQSPSHQIKKLNRAFIDLGYSYQLPPADFDGTIKYWDTRITRIFTECSECFPDAVAPHYLSHNMRVLLGMIELAQSALDDQRHEGYFTPLWWHEFCDITGGSPESFSIPKLVRLVSRFLMQVFFLTDVKESTMYNRYSRIIRKGAHAFDKINGEGCREDIIQAILRMARVNSHFIDEDYVRSLA